MKITAIRCRNLTGLLASDGPFWEERLGRPIDVYPEFRAEGEQQLEMVRAGLYRTRSTFLEIDTDSGVTGLWGPLGEELGRLIVSSLAHVLIGRDPRANELLWDLVYRASVHGRKGTTVMALSAVDNALWDIRGKWAGAPVYRLLGGATREQIPAYASMLGYAVEPEQAAARAAEFKARGYRAQKWFFRAVPADGPEGIRRNVALVRAVREAIGPDDELMLDCWMSWDLRYARTMAEQIAEYHPRWIEEPTLPDKYDTCAEIRRAVPFPVANGEHEYTRWGFLKLLQAGAQDVIQPDVSWAGGLSEAIKIAALASAYDVEVIPHGHQTHTNAHFLASQPPALCPWLEYLDKWNTIHQFFIKDKLVPVNGFVVPPQSPGIGIELDDDAIESEEVFS
mgnify:CR=1 FL=1